MQVGYDCEKGFVTFYMTAKIGAKILNLQSKLEKITQNVGALKEAVHKIPVSDRI